jgi:hypothetical protein
MPEDATLSRLDDQIDWYDRKSRYNQVGFKILKVFTITIAAAITMISVFLSGQSAIRISAFLGAMVLLCEGLQQLNQYQANWISYRSTCESLRHEKFLYLALAGPYVSAEGPHKLLAERIESLVSQEHAKWASTQEQSPKNTDNSSS